MRFKSLKCFFQILLNNILQDCSVCQYITIKPVQGEYYNNLDGCFSFKTFIYMFVARDFESECYRDEEKRVGGVGGN